MRRLLALSLLAALAVLGTGCDMLGIESASDAAARREADGKAVGGACRHAGRAIEDCFALNRKSDRAAIYAGWREMNEYMTENKLEAIVPELADPPAAAAAVDRAETRAEASADGSKDGDKPAAKAKAKKRDS